jgi:NitT/TauT family transport system substrate-binding protein
MLAGGLVLLVAAFATGRLGFDGRSASGDRLTIAMSSTPHAALLHLAVAKGYFAQEGLDVVATPVSHGKAALDLLTQGKVDLAAAAEVPFVISVLQGEELSIVTSIASVATEMALVARRDRGIAGPRDLAGKKVGVTLGTSGEYFLWAFLIRHKVSPDLVTMVDIPPGQLVAALEQGRIDAVSTWQPVRRGAEAALAAQGVTLSDPDAYTVTHVLLGRAATLKQRPDAMRRVVRALLEAEAFVKAEPAAALALIADRLKLPPNDLQPTWKELDLRVNLLQHHLVTLEDEARWVMARGYAKDGPIPNFMTNLSLDALSTVRPERVTVVH